MDKVPWRSLASFLRRDTVFTISLALAAGSFAAAPATDAKAVAASIDLKVLVCLFLLMAAVEGFRREGVLEAAAVRLTAAGAKSRPLVFALVGLTYFASMVVTNDVALITFVPFSLMTLRMAGQTHKACIVVILQTVAANLGSALTPVGNPQNLYLYTRYGMTPASFFSAVLPLAIPSMLLLGIGVLLLGNHSLAARPGVPAPFHPTRRLPVYIALFAVALLGVFDVMPAVPALLLGAILLAAFARPMLRRVDYALLATFVFFFVFIGNVTRMEPVRMFMESMLTDSRRVFLAGAGLSQLISNVPAAILLSGFTADAHSLLLGVDVGGCGTIVASLASLISYKAYLREHPGQGMRYVGIHTLVNLPFLLLLAACCLLAMLQ